VSLVLLLGECYCQQEAKPSTQEIKPASQVSTPICPINIIKVDPFAYTSFMENMGSGRNTNKNGARDFLVKIKNVSSKDIKGMKFQAAYYDATEDLHLIPVEWNWDKAVKDGEDKDFRWANELWKDDARIGWKVWLTKILFTDGTKWSAENSQMCFAEYWRDKKHKK